MISQLDPMIAGCKKQYYVEKHKAIVEKQNIEMDVVDEVLNSTQLKEMKKKEANNLVETLDESIFHCARCKKLVVNENNNIFNSARRGKSCIRCMIEG